MVFVFLFVDLFDNVGTLVGVGKKAGLFDKSNRIPRLRSILFADATATIAGSLAGTLDCGELYRKRGGSGGGGTQRCDGYRDRTPIVVALFVAPVVGAVPAAATAPALIVVGSLMMAQIGEIAWQDPAVAIPAFLTLITIPLTYSIANGLAFGFTAYALLRIYAVIFEKRIGWFTRWRVRVVYRSVFLSGERLKMVTRCCPRGRINTLPAISA